MKKTVLIATLTIGLLTIPFLVHAEVYKWIDDKGDVHFTDDYSSIPEKYRPLADTQRFPQDPKDTSPLSGEKKPTPPLAPKVPEPAVQNRASEPTVQKPPLVQSEVFEGVISKLDAFGRSFIVTGEKETMSFLLSGDTQIIDELGKEQHLEELRRRVETNPSTGVPVSVKYTRDGDDIHASHITLHGRKPFDGRDYRRPRPPRPPKPPK
jgi:hypothetical protein